MVTMSAYDLPVKNIVLIVICILWTLVKWDHDELCRECVLEIRKEFQIK